MIVGVHAVVLAVKREDVTSTFIPAVFQSSFSSVSSIKNGSRDLLQKLLGDFEVR